MTTLIIIAWVVMAITAYPRNKQFRIDDRGSWRGRDREKWTNGNMIESLLLCLVSWPIIWIWYIVSKINNTEVISNFVAWFEKDSLDTSLLSMIKKLFGKNDNKV